MLFMKYRKPYLLAQRDNVLDPEILVIAARKFRKDHFCTADKWKYLRTILENGKLDSDFLIKYSGMFSSMYLLTFNDGELIEEHGNQIVHSSCSYENPLIRDYLSPEYKFQFLGSGIEINHARYTTDAGMTIDVYPSRKYEYHRGFTTFKHTSGLFTSMHSELTSFEIYENRIYLNDIKSKFEIQLSEHDYDCLIPFNSYLASLCMSNNETNTRNILKASKSEPMNRPQGSPWLPVAIGAASGAVLGTAIASVDDS